MSQWPRDNQAALKKFFGDPAKNEVEPQLVRVVPPFKMYYDGRPVPYLLFHRKAAPALLSVLNDIWDTCGHDQSKLDKLGVSNTAGTYNKRKISGSAKWSNHAFGDAIDLDASRNGFGKGKGTIPQFVINAFKRQGFRWGGDYKGRTDPMHFEACDDGRGAPVGFMAADDFEAHEGDVPENGVGAEPVQAEDGFDTTEPPKTIDKAVVTTRAVAGTAAAIPVVGQAVSAVVGQTSDIADQVTSVVDKSGNVIAASKHVVSIAKPGFWNGVLHVVTSPGFLLAVIVAMGLAWAFVYFWQRSHSKAAT